MIMYYLLWSAHLLLSSASNELNVTYFIFSPIFKKKTEIYSRNFAQKFALAVRKCLKPCTLSHYCILSAREHCIKLLIPEINKVCGKQFSPFFKIWFSIKTCTILIGDCKTHQNLHRLIKSKSTKSQQLSSVPFSLLFRSVWVQNSSHQFPIIAHRVHFIKKILVFLI